MMRIDTPPILPLPGLFLRQIEYADLSDWYAYLRLPVTVEHTSWNLHGAEDLHALQQDFELATATSNRRLAIVDEEIGKMIGSIGFHTVSEMNRRAELAYDLAPQYWGRGVLTQASRSVCDWAYSHYGWLRLQACVLDSNIASERVLRKSGFQYEGTLRSLRLVRGRAGNFKMFSRLASDVV